MTRQFSVTFGLSEAGPMISSVTANGADADVNKVEDLRRQPKIQEEPVNVEGQVRAESVLSTINITSLGQEKTGDLLSLQDAYFSSLWAGQDRNHNVSLSFCFDLEKYVKNKVIFPVFSRITPGQDIWLEQLAHLDIYFNQMYGVSMRMFKQEIIKDKKTNSRFNRVSFEKNLKNRSVIAEYSIDMEEEVIEPGKMNRTEISRSGRKNLYTALDIRKETKAALGSSLVSAIRDRNLLPNYEPPGDLAGAYQYGVEVTLVDKTPDAMKKVFVKLNEQLSSLKLLANIITATEDGVLSNHVYNMKTEKFSLPIARIRVPAKDGDDETFPGLRAWADQNDGPSFFRFDNIISKSFQVLKAVMRIMSDPYRVWNPQLNNGDGGWETKSNLDTTAERYVDPLMNLSDQGTKSFMKLRRYIDFYETYVMKLSQKAKKVLPTLELDGVAVTNPRSGVGKKSKQITSSEYIFEEVVEINKRASSGYEFILEQDMFSASRTTALPIMSKPSYYQRVGKTIDKYFSLRIEQEDAENPLFPYATLNVPFSRTAQSALDPTKSAFSFLGPMAVTIDYRRNGLSGLRTIKPSRDLFKVYVELLNKKQNPNQTDNDLRPTPELQPWIDHRQVDSPGQVDSANLQEMLSNNSCQVRYTAQQQERQEVARRAGVDVFFGALPNDEQASVSQRQMLNNNLGEQQRPLARASAPPPKVSRLFSTLLADQIGTLKHVENQRIIENKASSIADVSYEENADGYQNPLSLLLINSAIPRPGDRPGNETDIPPQIKSLLATQYTRKAPLIVQETLKPQLRIHTLRPEASDELVSNQEGRELGVNYLFPVKVGEEFENAIDPMKNWQKFPSFWLNYKTIASVEYFNGFLTEGEEINIKQPIWKRLTKTVFESLEEDEKLFCRLEMVEGIGQSLGLGDSDLFDLPIYNKYFFIGTQDLLLDEEEQEEQDDFGVPDFY